jgi:type IV pilus assembly protein PilX
MSTIAFAIPATHGKPCQQSGVVLVIVLLFMLALSTIAIFGARNVTLGERQARNESEYQVARQAAEAALRDAERELYPDPVSLPPPSTPACDRAGSLFRSADRIVSSDEFTATCLAGQCWVPTARYSVGWKLATKINPGEPWWPISRGGVWTSSGSTCAAYLGPVPLGRYTGVAALRGVSQQPDYLIEYLDDPAQDSALVGKGFKCATPYIGGATTAKAAADQTDPVTVASEQMACYLFRITARGFGTSANTQVVMQSYFSIIKPKS